MIISDETKRAIDIATARAFHAFPKLRVVELEDLRQNAYEVLLRNGGLEQPFEHVYHATYLRSITYIRRYSFGIIETEKQSLVDDDGEEWIGTEEDLVERVDTAIKLEQLQDFYNRCNENQKLVLGLFFEGHNTSEIAYMLGKKTIRGVFNEIRPLLKRHILGKKFRCNKTTAKYEIVHKSPAGFTESKASHYKRAQPPANAKLTAHDVDEIKQLLAAGKTTQRAIAQKFNISEAQISAIKNKKGWISRSPSTV